MFDVVALIMTLNGSVFKLIGGLQRSASFPGISSPNSTTLPWDKKAIEIDCSNGCLFNLTADPTEHVNIGADAAYSEIIRIMILQHSKYADGIYQVPVGDVEDKVYENVISKNDIVRTIAHNIDYRLHLIIEC